MVLAKVVLWFYRLTRKKSQISVGKRVRGK